jgi:hypothetical protein
MPKDTGKKSTFIVAGVGVGERTLTQAVIEAGLFEGRRGQKRFNPRLRPLVDAVYHILSGGNVTGKVPGTLVVTAGIPAKVAQFKRLEKTRMAAINKIDETDGVQTLH